MYLSFYFWLTSPSLTISRSIHVAISGIIVLFLWLSNSPLFIRYHIFFIDSSDNEQLGCLHILDVVKKKKKKNCCNKNWGVCIFLEQGFLQRLLDHTVLLCLVFLGTSILFSAIIVPTYIPTHIIGGVPPLHTLSSIYCL